MFVKLPNLRNVRNKTLANIFFGKFIFLIEILTSVAKYIPHFIVIYYTQTYLPIHFKSEKIKIKLLCSNWTIKTVCE